MFNRLGNKIGNTVKRAMTPFKLERLKKGTILTREHVTYELKNTVYIPKKDLMGYAIKQPPSYYEHMLSYGNALKNHHVIKNLEIFVSMKNAYYIAGNIIVVGVFIVKAVRDMDIDLLKTLYSQTDLVGSANVLYDSAENQIIEYIKSLNCKVARIFLPNNVPPTELLEGSVDINPLDPVLNGLYVDLVDTYLELRSDAPQSADQSDIVDETDRDVEQMDRNRLFAWIPTFIVLIVSFLNQMVGIPMPV